MNLVVAGCGFVGEPLRQLLALAGHNVMGLSLSGSQHTRAVDISNLDQVTAAAESFGHADAVVHCASSGRGGDRVERYRNVYLNGTHNLLAAFPDARIIFTSSTSVYAQTDGSEIDENSPAEPTAETGKILRQAEGLALASGGAVARLGGIYGPGRSFLLKKFLLGEAKIDGRWINQIHRDDAASGLKFLLEDYERTGVFNIADNTPLWQADCYEKLSKRFELPVPPTAEPDPNRKRGWTNKRVSNTKLTNLGWEPRYSSYFAALENDPELVPSIIAQCEQR